MGPVDPSVQNPGKNTVYAMPDFIWHLQNSLSEQAKQLKVKLSSGLTQKETKRPLLFLHFFSSARVFSETKCNYP